MAIAVNGGHVSRALDFYEKENKYIAIGGSTAWDNEPSPDTPTLSDFKLRDIIGLKKVDNTFLVVPDNDYGTIVYRDQKWRVVNKESITKVGAAGVINGSYTVPVESVDGITVRSKVRINNQYEGTVTAINGTTLTLDTAATSTIAPNAVVQAGALIEGAKYVYIEGYLEYDTFPLTTYRQIGLCTGVVAADASNANILRSADYSASGLDEYTSLGILEVLDNRAPILRDMNMRELISMILEF